ncbi:MerR family transcriptional regulator [Methylorubrum extorquens]|nr:MerR family transcriptional regulator [Methylorubrum extorquens]
MRPLRTKQGQRRYRPEDLELLTGIRMLLHVQGHTIRLSLDGKELEGVEA